MNAGDTFHAQAPSSTREHLYIVLTDPDANSDVVIANVTSQEAWKDQTCVLAPDDHRFLTKNSVMNYSDAIISSDDQINEAVMRRLFRPDVRVSPEVLARVRQGALDSPHTEKRIKDAVAKALGN